MASISSAQLENQLRGINYPASKAELVRHLERNGADESVRMAISNLPNQSYDSLAAVNRALSSAQQGNMRQDQERSRSDQERSRQDQDRNHQDQAQQGRQQASR